MSPQRARIVKAEAISAVVFGAACVTAAVALGDWRWLIPVVPSSLSIPLMLRLTRNL